MKTCPNPNCNQALPKNTAFCPYCSTQTQSNVALWIRKSKKGLIGGILVGSIVTLITAVLIVGLFDGNSKEKQEPTIETPIIAAQKTSQSQRSSLTSLPPSPTLQMPINTQSSLIAPTPDISKAPLTTDFLEPTENSTAPTIEVTSTNQGAIIITPKNDETVSPLQHNPFAPTLAHQIIDDYGVPMVLVPAGDFIMGSNADEVLAECKELEVDGECVLGFEAEEPIHIVSLEHFYIDKFEVTNARYAQCVISGGCYPPDNFGSRTEGHYYGNPQFDDYPVIYVNKNNADAYCSWRDARLPTEAEWEKAARGTDGRLYPWGNTFDGKRVNFCDINCEYEWANLDYDDVYSETAPVGSYPAGASPYGVLDMSGNVWEWVADWYDVYPGGDPSVQWFYGQYYGIVRGAAWDTWGSHVRTAFRMWATPEDSDFNTGFRCARSP